MCFAKVKHHICVEAPSCLFLSITINGNYGYITSLLAAILSTCSIPLILISYDYFSLSIVINMFLIIVFMSAAAEGKRILQTKA